MTAAAAVIGAATTAFGKFPERSIRAHAHAAVGAALDDAGVTAEQIGMVFFANAAAGLVTGQEMIRGQAALRGTGLLGRPVVNVENACSSGSTAFELAVMAVSAGACDTAIAVGAEKLTHADRARSLGVFDAGIALDDLAQIRQRVYGEDGAAGDGSLFMDVYAALARDYMARSGATAADFAAVAVKSHRHGALNPKAQYRDEVSVEEVLASRSISDPLTLLMCSPIGDGAAALVVARPEVARADGRRPVWVRATALVAGDDIPGHHAPSAAARLAYERGGLGPEDVDVVELHDAAAPAELMLYEDLLLCGPGEGPDLLRSGTTSLGGRCVVNPSGGLLAKGHPIGATGCAQLVELTEQLRGEAGARQVRGARIGLAENTGGFLGPDFAVAGVTILEGQR